MNCVRCNTIMLQYHTLNENRLCCVKCERLDLMSEPVVNASFYSYSNPPMQLLQPIIPESIQPRPKAFHEILHTELATSVKPKLEYITKQYDKEIKLNTYVQTGMKINIDWSKIIGYEQIKHIISAALNNTHKKKTHIMLCGSPGTSKTVFLLTIQESLKAQGINAHYLDATTLSSSGVIEYMFQHDMNYALIDELDKCKKEHQAVFLNCLETGILQETKNKKIRRKEMKNCVFIITANYKDKILEPLFTRMLPLLIPEYTKEEFYKIGTQLLHQQYGKTKDIAYYIVDQVYNIFLTERKEKPNMRYCRDIALLTDNNKSNIDPILKGITTYSKQYDL